MTERASHYDLDYMRRLGEFKAWSKREALEEHLSLTFNERLIRSERLTKRDPERDAPRAQQDDPEAFFRRARELGICDA